MRSQDRFLYVAVLSFLFALLLSGMSLAENRALLVGCDRFLSLSDTTPSSERNVEEMADALSGGAMNLETLITRRYGISGADELRGLILEAFEAAQPGDVSYFYISTHGLWEPGEPGESMTLLLSDGRTEYGITARQLKYVFDSIQGTKVLIVDACHAGAMIGKGIRDSLGHIFEGDEYKVICSSGGAEESWFWRGSTADGEEITGGGYFSGILSAGISVRTGYAADRNRDGIITLSEISSYLLQMHGASTVHTYPEEDDFPILVYTAEGVKRQTDPLGNISFSDSTLEEDGLKIPFAFTVFSPCRVAYQLVYQAGNRWDFAHARLLYDTGELFGTYGDAEGWLSPGYKERTLTLTEDIMGYSGYLLLQMVVTEGSEMRIVASRAIGISTRRGAGTFALAAGEVFAPDAGEEMGFTLSHTGPVVLWASILDSSGNTVKRIVSGVSSRPEQLYPEGTSLYWDGKDTDGELAEAGEYHLHLRVRFNGGTEEIDSEPFLLER
ncbi:MAG: caspase family protein [Clostridia bacterium]|nr:caspase family protein [Clostridia bacterium]